MSSVSRIVVADRKIICARPGNGVSAIANTGSDSAAAIVTDPRRPAHPTTNTARGLCAPSRFLIDGMRSGGR